MFLVKIKEKSISIDLALTYILLIEDLDSRLSREKIHLMATKSYSLFLHLPLEQYLLSLCKLMATMNFDDESSKNLSLPESKTCLDSTELHDL